jgi:hypothetical protein
MIDEGNDQPHKEGSEDITNKLTQKDHLLSRVGRVTTREATCTQH